jgi:hypothetical protein
MDCEHTLATVSDDELLRRLIELLKHTRRAEADLVAHIGEVDARRLFAREAFPSMFAYCIDVLHLSEAEAYLRITAARAAREHPLLLDMLADGRLHLSGIGKLAPHLTPANRDSLLQRATGKTKRQIEELTAEIAPRPDVPPVMRKLPARTPGRGPEVAGRTVRNPVPQLCPGLPALQLRWTQSLQALHQVRPRWSRPSHIPIRVQLQGRAGTPVHRASSARVPPSGALRRGRR